MKVLLVVDMQKGFMNSENYKHLNKKIAELIDGKYYDKYIFTKFKNDSTKNPLYQSKLNWNKLMTDAEQEFSINLPSGAMIIEKYGYGLQSEDLEYIKSLNINEIDICGIESEACIYAISLQLWDKGIYPNILSKYIAGKQNMEAVFKRQFGFIK